jgi:HNH endonuclease
MPLATICLDCGRPSTQIRKGRCPECARERDRNDPYQKRSWREIRKVSIKEMCEIPGCGSTERLVGHHSIARREGGPDAKENIVTLCNPHHSQYEADKRTGKRTHLRALVEAL